MLGNKKLMALLFLQLVTMIIKKILTYRDKKRRGFTKRNLLLCNEENVKKHTLKFKPKFIINIYKSSYNTKHTT